MPKTRTLLTLWNGFQTMKIKQSLEMKEPVRRARLDQERAVLKEKKKIYGVPGTNNKPNSYKEASMFEIRNILMEKARKEIRNKLSEWSSAAPAQAGKKEKEKVKPKEKKKTKRFNEW